MRVSSILSQKAIAYCVAVVTAAAALYLHYLLKPVFGEAYLYHTSWVAVVFCSWYCGLWPSILCAALCALGVNYFFLAPVHSFIIYGHSHQFGLIGFLVFSGVVIALSESSRRGSSSRALLASIVDSSDDAIISKNLDGVITSWNHGAEGLFGWTAAEAIGKPITIIIPEELRDQEVEIMKRLKNGERIEHLETRRRKKSGEQIEVSLTVSPVMSPLGKVVGVSKIARDIRERKRAEAQLKVAHDHLEGRVAKRTAELREKNEQLLRQTETVRELSGHLLRSQDEERRRIARELHDSVGQLLVAVSMNVSSVSNASQLSPEDSACVKQISELTAQALTEIRTISHLLHPPLLDEVGLESAVRHYIGGFAQRSKIDINFVISPGFERLSHEHELTIFRVVQECLTNIHRHSGSQTAKIYLTQKKGFVHCEIQDEGKGISQEQQLTLGSAAAVGVGLRGMRERVSQLGGILQIHSHGKGTTVTVTLPVTRSVRELARSATG